MGAMCYMTALHNISIKTTQNQSLLLSSFSFFFFKHVSSKLSLTSQTWGKGTKITQENQDGHVTVNAIMS